MKRTSPRIAEAPTQNWADADELALLRAALSRDSRAWNEFVKRYDAPLREVVRHATEATQRPLNPTEIEDVMGDFWANVVERDLRLLRSFNSTRGAPLFSLLTFHVAQIAYDHVHRAANEPHFVPLSQARHVADPRSASVKLRHESNNAGSIDAALRECVRSTVVSVVREELAHSRRATENSDADRPRSAAWWAEQLGCSAESLIKRAKRGSLEATKIGARYYFTRGQVDGSRCWQRRKTGAGNVD